VKKAYLLPRVTCTVKAQRTESLGEWILIGTNITSRHTDQKNYSERMHYINHSRMRYLLQHKGKDGWSLIETVFNLHGRHHVRPSLCILSMDMSLSKPQEMVKDRAAWHAAVHVSQTVRHDLATEPQQTGWGCLKWGSIGKLGCP
jgi:hypothetical protein